MNIKNLLAVVAFAAAGMAFAEAESDTYLYWMVDLTEEGKNPYGVESFTYATVSCDGGSSYLSFYNTAGESVGTGMSGKDDSTQLAGPLYVKIDSSYDGSFLFELWKEDDKSVTRVGWASYTRAQLNGSIYETMGTAGGYMPMSVAVVPEPSSALLLLLGIAGLALRRRKGLLALVAVASLHLGAFASAANLVYSFQPSADDSYADGTPIQLGERYALVWLTNGASGVEIAANGTLTDPSRGEIVQVRASSTVKKGRIFTFQVEESIKDALVAKGGKWAVYLLDTRIYGANGGVTLAEIVDGKVGVVNAAELLEKSVKAVAALSVESNTVKTDKDGADVVTAVPADAPQPEITGVEVVDGKVHVKVSRTVPYLQYNLAAGASPDAVSGKAAESPRNGVQGDEIELVAPASGGSGFFRVNRN